MSEEKDAKTTLHDAIHELYIKTDKKLERYIQYNTLSGFVRILEETLEELDDAEVEEKVRELKHLVDKRVDELGHTEVRGGM